LGIAFLAFMFTFFFQKAGVKRISFYVILGAIAWFAVLKSGIHATIAGVVLGFLTPGRALYFKRDLPDKIEKQAKVAVDKLRASEDPEHLDSDTIHAMQDLEDTLEHGQPVLERLVHGLHGWVSYGIIPLFAFVNAGVHVEGVSLGGIVDNPIALGIILGLFLGKPIGVVLFSFIATKMKIAALPQGINWAHMLGVGALAGIGFTMALFISGLALAPQPELEMFSKMGILIGSLFSAILGAVVLLSAGNKSKGS
jgi:NhaA family Na+:H+ antiporter